MNTLKVVVTKLGKEGGDAGGYIVTQCGCEVFRDKIELK